MRMILRTVPTSQVVENKKHETPRSTCLAVNTCEPLLLPRWCHHTQCGNVSSSLLPKWEFTLQGWSAGIYSDRTLPSWEPLQAKQQVRGPVLSSGRSLSGCRPTGLSTAVRAPGICVLISSPNGLLHAKCYCSQGVQMLQLLFLSKWESEMNFQGWN